MPDDQSKSFVDSKPLLLKASQASSPDEFAQIAVGATARLGVGDLAKALLERFKLPDKKTAKALVEDMLSRGILRVNKAGRLMPR